MSFSFFGWLRAKARESVLGGVADALEELAPAADQAQPANLDRLRGLAAAEVKALPAAADDEPKKGRARG